MVSSSTRKKRRTRPKRSDPTLIFLGSDEFFNRELSWIEFNRRVLHQAQASTTPLLERVRFLSICISNFDEFFMNRIGGLKQRIEAMRSIMGDATDPEKLLARVRDSVLQSIKEQDDLFERDLLPSLKQNGIRLLTWNELSARERESASTFFEKNIFPVLTPQAVDPGHPFPSISNLSLSLGVLLKHPERDEELFARVKIPSTIPQIVRLEAARNESFRGITAAEVIRNNLSSLFPGMVVRSVLPFRITRNAEIDVDDYEAEDLVESISEGLKERKFAQAVRLEHSPDPCPITLALLLDEVGISPEDVYVSRSAIEIGAIKDLCDLPVPHLKFESWNPVNPSQFTEDDSTLFSTIQSGDVLVHHPYESFAGSVERFLRAAVEDPKVISIKMTLYRAGDNSSLIPLLIRAAEREKQVVCLIEVKASFDEARNIRHAQLLEEAGVHVMYGVVGLKTHAKLILVARQESDGVRCYGHITTGNYNSTTARYYTDVGLFTANPLICNEMVELFHFLTGRSLKRDYKYLVVAPVAMKEHLLAMIEREVENYKKGLPAHIIIKANSLEDHATCRALSKAAAAGVPMDLIIRGICCLKPSVNKGEVAPRVVSIVGRFLEHSRIYYFRSGESDPLNGDLFISSADPMYRNLHRRVEVSVPVLDPGARLKCWEILSTALHDSVTAWDLQPTGTYALRRPDASTFSMGSQQLLMKITKDRARNVRDPLGV